MITTTLDAMAAGGIYDQVGGGFPRYSTDAYWLVPHFEKMLYDKALLTRAYLHGWLAHRRAALPRASSRRRSVRAARPAPRPDGGFFSAEDADSEGDRGQVLRLVARRDRGGLRRRRRRGRPLLRRHRGRELRRSAHRLPRQHPARRRPHRGAAARGAARPRRAVRAPRASRCGPGSTTRCCSAGTRCSSRALAEAGAALDRPDWMEAARDERAVPPRATCGATTAGSCDRGRSRGRGALAPRVRRGLRRAARGAAHPGRGRRRRVARARRARSPTSCCASSPTTTAAGSSPPGTTPRRSSCGPKDYEDNATPSENSLAADGAAAPGRAHRRDRATRAARGRGARHDGAARRRAPDGVRVPARRARAPRSPPIEIAVVGDPTTPGPRRCAHEVTSRLLPASVTLARLRRRREPVSPLLADRAAGRRRADRVRVRALRVPRRRSPTPAALRAQLDRRRSAAARSGAESAGGVEGAGREGLGDGPAERDHRLAPGRVERRRPAARPSRHRWP